MTVDMAAAQQNVANFPPTNGQDIANSAILAEIEALSARVGAVRSAIFKVIFGQEEVVDHTLISLLSGGHALGKSRLVETLGTVLGVATKRVQFTPDLMPADIIGSEVLDEAEGKRTFRFLPGPVFCQLLMADEINRASPRTQSALLQAMQEGRVAVGGVEHALPRSATPIGWRNGRCCWPPRAPPRRRRCRRCGRRNCWRPRLCFGGSRSVKRCWRRS
jgi:transcriptional regulator of acetoin/glycerol metabolism